MVLIFEQDVRDHGQGRFRWVPTLFVGRWRGRRTWNLGWGLWSVSYYPEPGLRPFFEWVEKGKTSWKGGRAT